MTQTHKFTKNPSQLEAVRLMGSTASNILLFGGSRSGKTFIIIRQFILRGLKASGSRHCILRKHQTDIRRSLWLDTLPKVLELCFPGLVYRKYEQDMRLVLPNGSELWFGGLDKGDKILGNEYASIFVNEISEIVWSQIELAKSRLAQRCDNLVNKFYYDCNPPSKSHWSYKVFVLKVNPEDNLPLNDPLNYVSMQLNPTCNVDNISKDYLKVLDGMSAKKRQRFRDGVWTDDNENALWKRTTMINPYRMQKVPGDLERIVVAIDPAVTSKETSDETGIVVAGKMELYCDGVYEDHYFVMSDRSLRASPNIWATTAINAYHEYYADRIVAEVNNGGDLVESTIRNVDRNVSYRGVHASRGKMVRAEPIAALYEKGLVHHIGEFSDLEDELCNYCGHDNEVSPNRFDAVVWALAALSQNIGGSEPIYAN